MKHKCKNCHKIFDAKNHMRTKFCYTCVPQGASAAPFLKNSNGDMFKCKSCGRTFKYKRNSYHDSRNICGVCQQSNHKREIKTKAIAMLGGRCWSCRYKRCVEVMTFHHINPRLKEFNICRKYGYSWKRIKREIKKCALLCMNCHMEIHAGVKKCPLKPKGGTLRRN